ncbi:Holliday junction recognition protein isoform X2 [Ranitomeya imitator]|uniref:Holliday junction recognition protein isoform X2 n=1 Tax=Ranitomeya imitator TaxID=111125 RepID=UPI0037E7BC1F
MEKSVTSGESKTPGIKKIAEESDFIKGLDRSERGFQSRMKNIFKKYNRPFDNDVVVFMEDLTYETRNEADDCGKTQRIVPKVEQFSGQTSVASMRYEKENPYTDDREGYASKPNCDMTVFNKTVRIALPLKATVSNVKSFNDMSDKVLLKSPVRSNVVVFIANDSEISDNEETSFSEPGNTTLEDFYPQMIQNMSRVWNVNMRNMAAFNILRHYRRQILCRHKLTAVKMVNRCLNKTFTILPAPHVEETVNVLDSTLLQDECLSRSDHSVKSQKPSLILGKLGSPGVSSTHHHLSRGNRNKPFERIVDNRAVYRDSPLPCKQHKEESCVTALCNGSRASSDFCKMANSPTRSVINESQMFVDIAKSSYGKDSRQQHTPSRRKYFSGSSMWQSPKNKVVRVNCNMSEMAGSTSRYLTSQSLVDVDERKHGCYNEHTGQLVDKTRSLTRRNSFSGFPVAHSPNKEFENLYKKLTQAKCGPDYTLGKAKVQFSNTIASLVNSPGSVRAKRPISHDLSFSMSKKPRSATEAVVGTSKSSSCSPTWSGASCAQSHLVASALPAHMWPYSSGSQLKRSISPGKNGGSPNRTNARIYRKLTYQDEDR